MKRQTIRCRDCANVVAYVQHRENGPHLKFQFGTKIFGVENHRVTEANISSQWFVVNIDEELHETTDSNIEVECGCAENGRPRRRSFPLRATLDALGTRRGMAL